MRAKRRRETVRPSLFIHNGDTHDVMQVKLLEYGICAMVAVLRRIMHRKA